MAGRPRVALLLTARSAEVAAERATHRRSRIARTQKESRGNDKYPEHSVPLGLYSDGASSAEAITYETGYFSVKLSSK